MLRKIVMVVPVKRRPASEIQAEIDRLVQEKSRLQDTIREAMWENEAESDYVKSLLRQNAELSTKIETLKWALGEML